MLELIMFTKYYTSLVSGNTGLSKLLIFAFSLITIIAGWKLFKKAGLEGYKAIIPFYNLYCKCSFVLGNGLYFLIFCIPVVNLIFAIYFTICLMKSFDCPRIYILLLLLSPALLNIYIAFSDLEYIGPKGIAVNDNTANDTNISEE